MITRTRRRASLLACLVLIPALAQAHPGHGTATFGLGILHPFTGLDHLLVMLAIGVWAAQLGGRLRWTVPLSFVLLMLVGAGLAAQNGALAADFGLVEQGIAASVLVCGLLLAFAVRLAAPACVAIAGGFALLHGYAHAAEGPGQTDLVAYVAGFTLGTAALHAAGFGIAVCLARGNRRHALRWTGAAVALCGAALLTA
jgi:urease accessory protein